MLHKSSLGLQGCVVVALGVAMTSLYSYPHHLALGPGWDSPHRCLGR